MKELSRAVLVLAAVSAAVLFLASPASASADTVKVYYQPVQDIQVVFPNGTEIEKGDELIIVISSSRYDMARSGIMFYERSQDGSYDRTSTVTPDHTSKTDGNTVTHIFTNLTRDIEMHFSDLVVSDSHFTDDIPANSAPDGRSATMLMAVSAVIAAVMLTAMASIIRKIDSLSEGSEGIS